MTKEQKRKKNQKRKKEKNGETLYSYGNAMLNGTVGLSDEANDMRDAVCCIELMIIVMLIFPNRDDETDVYFNNVFTYCTSAVKTRLHIDAAKFTVFTDLLGAMRTPAGPPPGTNGAPGTWNYVYPLSKNKSTSTHDLKTDKKALKIAIKAAILDMYSDIPDSAIITADTTNLGITKKSDRKKPTKEPAKITTLVVIGLTPLGGGEMRITCRIATDSKRASKPFKACNIEIAYSLIERKGIPPAIAADCSTIKTLTKANTILTLGEDAQGMLLVLFARWIYTKHPTKSGEFGTSVSRPVS